MAQSLAKNLIHLVFSTSKREPVLAEAMRAPLCAYAAGVLRDLDSPAIAICAWRDHLSCSVQPEQESAPRAGRHEAEAGDLEMVQNPRARNSPIVTGKPNTAHSPSVNLGWEEARAYIANQPEHHRRNTFQ